MIWQNLKLRIILLAFAIAPNIGSPTKDVTNMIRTHGYDVEIHHAVSEDGYITELHRIPRARFEPGDWKRIHKPVILLSHGALGSSSQFVIQGPDNGLAYKLANEGYDVWMINFRGSSYSSKHQTMSSKSMKFWKFGLHEQGLYDYAATIDYVLSLTNATQMDFVGYSMGITHMFILLSERPHYNNKIRTMFALSPAIYISNSKGFMANLTNYVSFFIDVGLMNEDLRIPNPTLRKMVSSVCNYPQYNFYNDLCQATFVTFGANHNGNINMEIIPQFMDYFPDTMSLRCAVHFVQIYKAERFQKYNYGKTKNRVMYGQDVPPEYDLSKVTAPMVLFWSKGDRMTSPQDLKTLKKKMNNLVLEYEIPFTEFSHLDFIVGKNAPSLVYDVILRLLKEPRTYIANKISPNALTSS